MIEAGAEAGGQRGTGVSTSAGRYRLDSRKAAGLPILNGATRLSVAYVFVTRLGCRRSDR
jgi:hypothetical protein